MEPLRRQLADLAVQVAREGFQVRLDYSVESVRAVDQILAALHAEYRRTGITDGIAGLGWEFGAYLTYVIDRNFTPGKLHRDSPEVGPASFPFDWNGAVIFPGAWCTKQILSGEEDSVWVKFQVLVVRRWKEKRG